MQSYLTAVEPIRLGVNQLLEGADPVLDAYRGHRLSGHQAAAAMSRLEHRFAAYRVDINSLRPANSTVAGINGPYAHTYILEDAYLNAVVAALLGGDFSTLPNTQAAQRSAIIAWRVELEILGRTLNANLPADLQQASRAEVAPSVFASS